jgi:hypothetical protein
MIEKVVVLFFRFEQAKKESGDSKVFSCGEN